MTAENMKTLKNQLAHELDGFIKTEIETVLGEQLHRQLREDLPGVVARRLDTDVNELAKKIAAKGDQQLSRLVQSEAQQQLAQQVIELLKSDQSLMKQVWLQRCIQCALAHPYSKPFIVRACRKSVSCMWHELMLRHCMATAHHGQHHMPTSHVGN